jgi:SAM-dependent methyltransferase
LHFSIPNLQSSFSQPAPELLQQQAAWLEPARARLLRRVQIAQRKLVLDLGCGPGAVSGELVRRAGGRVVALDWSLNALTLDSRPFAGAHRVCGDAERLPFADDMFDLIFAQFTLLWINAAAAVREAHRALQPGGALVALEPDYGGLIEHPGAIITRPLWRSGLRRAGAEPEIGRRLPGLLRQVGFQVQVDLLDHLASPSPMRFDFLRGLPLSETERESLRTIEQADRQCDDRTRVVHLPVFLITATK